MENWSDQKFPVHVYNDMIKPLCSINSNPFAQYLLLGWAPISSMNELQQMNWFIPSDFRSVWQETLNIGYIESKARYSYEVMIALVCIQSNNIYHD